ncbi:uncharacterized protein N7498_006135 [Penicillium cinerascens]|uniref:Uncharacterized protein n=1 Tax=Penicillium cinerascens TaxID=70096 RepID=A0A9W9MHZ4_9EURO|nr:uncharacterized protein N7498_006135 [Penicillium cinerascens]KAJ5201472.1 hypothetical protein N7498_006135 [Penicillium cinerascens]
MRLEIDSCKNNLEKNRYSRVKNGILNIHSGEMVRFHVEHGHSIRVDYSLFAELTIDATGDAAQEPLDYDYDTSSDERESGHEEMVMNSRITDTCDYYNKENTVGWHQPHSEDDRSHIYHLRRKRSGSQADLEFKMGKSSPSPNSKSPIVPSPNDLKGQREREQKSDTITIWDECVGVANSEADDEPPLRRQKPPVSRAEVSNAAMIAFEKRAQDLETASLTATIDNNSIVNFGTAFDRLSISEQPKAKGKRSDSLLKRPFFQQASSRLNRQASDLSISTVHTSTQQTPQEPPYKDSGSYRHRLSFSSISNKHGRSSSLENALISISGQMAAIGGNHSIPEVSPDTEARPMSVSAINCGRSSSEVPWPVTPRLMDPKATAHGEMTSEDLILQWTTLKWEEIQVK